MKQFGNEASKTTEGVFKNKNSRYKHDHILLPSPCLSPQLNGILDTRPPVSRAKMASITKLAMKSHKVRKQDSFLTFEFNSAVVSKKLLLPLSAAVLQAYCDAGREIHLEGECYNDTHSGTSNSRDCVLVPGVEEFMNTG